MIRSQSTTISLVMRKTIRNYLEKYFTIEEEARETNADLVLNKRYPIEIKKDPSQSEYDRLLGQMIRHNKLYGSAIAIITNVSSQDRFKKFQKLLPKFMIDLECRQRYFSNRLCTLNQ